MDEVLFARCHTVSVLLFDKCKAIAFVFITFLLHLCFSATIHCREAREPDPPESRHCPVYLPSRGSAPATHHVAKEWRRCSLKWED